MNKKDLVIGKTYVVSGRDIGGHIFKKGTEVKYIKDDDTDMPEFEDVVTGKTQYVHVDDISEVKVTHDLRAKYELSVGNFTLKLEGDGPVIPRLKLKAYTSDSDGFQVGYIGAENLRVLAKQLKKWAKGLEANGA